MPVFDETLDHSTVLLESLLPGLTDIHDIHDR